MSLSLHLPSHLAVGIDGDGTHPTAWRRAAHASNTLLTLRRVRTTLGLPRPINRYAGDLR